MSHSEETGHSSLLDKKVLEDLRKLSADGHVNYLDRAISLYEKTSPQLVKSIHEAIARNEAQALFFAAHSLKSSSALLGATSLSSLCLKLENMGRNDAMHDAASLLQVLNEEFEGVLCALEQEKSGNHLEDGMAH
jgi:HPt (histidine-containing phosphotransfer) domain-containing protein